MFLFKIFDEDEDEKTRRPVAYKFNREGLWIEQCEYDKA